MAEEQNIFLSLGSNLGDRYKNIINGINLLNNHPHIWVVNESYIYETSPMYNSNQNKFYNIVIEIETNILPVELLDVIKEIEKKTGRELSCKRNMPRTLDVDILVFGDSVIQSDFLSIPHPRIKERNFVLKPWSDIAPDYIMPNQVRNINELLIASKDTTDIKMVLI